MSSNELQQSPRWQRRPEDRPDEILDAATTVFGEQGFARTRLEDVAKRAGVSKGTLYLYFDSKEALFREMVRRNVVSVVAEAEAKYLNHPGTAQEALTAMVHGWWEQLGDRESACIHRLVGAELSSFPELGRFYFEEVIARSRRLISALIQRGVASGEFRPVAHEYAVRGLPSLVIHAINTQRFFSAFDPDALDDTKVIDGILDLFFHGVLAAPAPVTASR
ncbi:MAG: TetR/AcrR family transcriptional regulator [Gemmatimonadetes bacterium]|nr:TetR/AcrR family transcriptional regulator [Gemmatimonadota bacterium]